MEIIASVLGLISSHILFSLLISVISIVIFLNILFPFNSKTNTSLIIPSPIALPIIGHLHLLSPIPHQSFHRLALRFGPIFRLRIGCVSCLVVSSPSLAKSFLKTHEASFSDRPATSAMRTLLYDIADFTFARYDPYWRFIKRLSVSQLFGGQTLDLLHQIRRDEIQKLVKTLFEKSKRVEEVELDTELVRLGSNVISRMSFGRQWAGTDDELVELKTVITEVEELLALFDLKDHIWVLKKLGFDFQGIVGRVEDARGRFDQMVERVLREKEAARQKKKGGEDGGEEMMKGSKDILELLMDVNDDDNKAQMKLTRDNIKSFILGILAAGTSTTGLTIGWALSELINHPDVMKRLAAEIDIVVGKDRLVDETDIARLPYLQAVVKETLRLHPTGPLLGRQCTETCTVDGYTVPAGMLLFVNVWALGRDPTSWTNPLDFNPERFINEDNVCEIDVRGQHYQFLPFGTGRRICPGATLAMLVVQSTLAVMVQCFDWKLSGGGLVDMTERPGLMLTRVKPLICMPVPRLDQLLSSL
ncbi:hypothetical protein LUZ62_052930 [Rhynchospora pubera]|uniref:Cytochrome P450 n=1 Tax=Rhynchospora pubera TaxID=906938 RepID=A0AAV8GBV5_9POAL|nr:hypothetical protein LUZ62_052930 [Rhynchospora pubera]